MQYQDLKRHHIAILSLFKAVNRINGTAMRDRFRSYIKLNHYIDELVRNNYIKRSRNAAGDEWQYRLGEQGIAYLQQKTSQQTQQKEQTMAQSKATPAQTEHNQAVETTATQPLRIGIFNDGSAQIGEQNYNSEQVQQIISFFNKFQPA